MDKRRERRTKKRLVCSFEIAGNRHSGIVLDVSPHGLFVQTSEKLKPGTEFEIALDLPGASGRLSLTVVVARQKIVPQELLSVARGGLGLTILTAPEQYFAFVANIAPSAAPPERAKPAESAKPAKRAESAKRAKLPESPESAKRAKRAKSAERAKSAVRAERAKRAKLAKRAKPADPAAPKNRYRARLKQVGGSRTRSLVVMSDSEAEAREQVVAEVGEGWKILELESA